MNIALMSSYKVIEEISKLSQEPAITERLCWELSKHYREKNPLPTEFETHWYKSVEQGQPDFSIYNGERYVAEATSCYLIYAKKYIKLAAKFIEDKFEVNEIWDLGCGIGASTCLLKMLFSQAKVYGTQLPSAQRKVAEALGKDCGFEITDTMNSTGNAIVFMLDYLEHFQCPTEHLETIIAQQPKLLVMANSFGATAVGHFPKYKIGDSTFTNKETGRKFSQWLKNKGYKKLDTGFYNNRPAIWEKI